MTIINPNSIAGITSVTAEAGVMNFYKSDGTLAGLQLNGVNFNTTSGISTFNNVYVGGTITYEDVKNVDSVGIITARAGIVVQGDSTFTGANSNAVWDSSANAFEFQDNTKLFFGTGDDLQISHDGSHSYLINKTGTLFFYAKATEPGAKIIPDGAVELYYNGSKKFETAGGGVNVIGDFYHPSDSSRSYYGASNDLAIWHDGSHSRIGAMDGGDGRLIISGRDGSANAIGLQLNAEDSKEAIICRVDGSVDLYHNGSKKFETTSAGTLTQGDIVVTDAVYLSNASTISSRLTLNSENTSSWQGTRDLVAFDLIGNGADHRTGTLSIKVKKLPGDSSPTEMMRLDGVNNLTTFYTAGSERLRIDSSGRLMLGTTTPGAAQVDTFTLETSGHTGMTFFSGTSNRGQIAFGDGRSGNAQYRGVIMYDHSDDSMRFVTSDAERLRITSTGEVCVNATARTNLAGTQYSKLLVDLSNNPDYVHFKKNLAQDQPILNITHNQDYMAAIRYANSGDAWASGVQSDGSYFFSHGMGATGGGGTERFRIDTSGRVLIGTTTEGYSSGDDLTIATSGHTGITIRSGTTSEGAIYFSDATSGAAEYIGSLVYSHNTNAMVFTTNGSERFRIDASGRVIVGGGTHAGGGQLVVMGGNINTYAAVSLGNKVTAPTDNTTFAMFRFSSGSGGTSRGAEIIAAADANWSAGSSYPTRLVFSTTASSATSSTERLRIASDGAVLPGADNTQDLGSSSKRWANLYTGDLHLSNSGSGNSVDGTSGSWTMQEGSDDLFLINNKTGKKYKFNLTEVN